jgi:ribosome-binding factor A
MSNRLPRVNQLIKQELSQIILKEIEFPKDILVTVTRVETTPNLIESKIYVSVMPENKSENILQILNKQIYDIQQRLNKRLKMRPVPRIYFRKEKETAEAGKVEEILAKIKRKD